MEGLLSKIFLVDFSTKEIYRSIDLNKSLNSVDDAAIFRLKEWEKLRALDKEIYECSSSVSSNS